MDSLETETLIEDSDWAAMSIKDKLAHYIETTPSSENDFQDDRARIDFWGDILGISSAGYNSAVDDLVIGVLERICARAFFADSAHEELIAYIICNAGLATYGTSPRAAFVEYGLEELLPKAVERWRKDWL